MATGTAPKPKQILLAACLVTGVFGSLHSFSVFIVHLEQALYTSRAQISAIYSFALLFLTLAVLFGHRVFVKLTASRFTLITGFVACCGLSLAAATSSLLSLGLGYSVLFGVANGLGYSYSLQLVAQTMPSRRGFCHGFSDVLHTHLERFYSHNYWRSNLVSTTLQPKRGRILAPF